MPDILTRTQMLERLERVTLGDAKKDRADELAELSLADSLLMLARLDHEQEYGLCRKIAEHLLGHVPEPDDADLGEI
jgi:hypothetical protein